MSNRPTEPRDPIRLVTVKATGRRYILKQIDFRDKVIFCRGEVVKAEGLRTQHGPDQCLQLADVTVSSELKTQGLVNALFEQSVEVARAALVPGRFLEVTRRDPGQRRSRKATYTPGSAQWERDRDAYDAKLLTAEASEAPQE